MENNSQDFDSPRRSMQQSPTKLQNKSEMMNSQLSPDKDKRPEKTKNEAVFIKNMKNCIFIFVFLENSVKK